MRKEKPGCLVGSDKKCIDSDIDSLDLQLQFCQQALNIFKPGLHRRKQFKDPSHLVKRKSWPWVGDLLDEVVRVGSVARKELESWRTRCCHEEMSSLNLKCIFVPQG